MPIGRTTHEELAPIDETVNRNWTRAITSGFPETSEQPSQVEATPQTYWFITLFKNINIAVPVLRILSKRTRK